MNQLFTSSMFIVIGAVLSVPPMVLEQNFPPVEAFRSDTVQDPIIEKLFLTRVSQESFFDSTFRVAVRRSSRPYISLHHTAIAQTASRKYNVSTSFF
ncbi:MAG TPA: hypothetical protein VK901_13500 [Nitrospiraceae bacterium]|nr:hypothetical protein [Nitrospiraceae bacterium]